MARAISLADFERSSLCTGFAWKYSLWMRATGVRVLVPRCCTRRNELLAAWERRMRHLKPFNVKLLPFTQSIGLSRIVALKSTPMTYILLLLRLPGVYL